jgi:hypothetical protein
MRAPRAFAPSSAISDRAVIEAAPESLRFSSRGQPLSEPPGSGPVSGVVNPWLFRGDGGAGYIIADEPGVEGVWLELLGVDAGPCTVIRMSPEAIWFRASSLPRHLMWNRPLSLRIKWSGGTIGPIRGQVVPLNGSARSYLGMRLLNLSMDAGRRILAMLGELVRAGRAQAPTQEPKAREDVTDAERLQTIMRTLASVGNSGVVRKRGSKGVRVAVERVDRAASEIVWSSSAPLAEWGEGPFAIDVIGYNSVYRLDVAEARQSGEHIVTPLPTVAHRARHRWFRRGRVNGALSIKCTHPLWPDIELLREIRDISFGGICFSADLDEDMLYPGLVIPALVVKNAEGEPIYLRGEVRSIFPERGDEPAACGLSVTPLSPEDDKLWVKLVCDALYPTIKTSENHLEPLWDLYAASGYFNLAGKSSDYFDELKRSFVDIGQRAAQTPELICQAVWPSDRGVEGTCSFLKAYHHSWMGHQLAKRPGHPPAHLKEPGQILRDVYLRVFEHPQSDPDLKWLMCYLEPHVAWMKKAHVDFADKHAGPGAAFNMTFSMFEIFSSDALAAGAPKWEIGIATPQEKSLLLAVLQETQRRDFLEALDLVWGRLDMAELSRQWKAGGFERDREILIARQGGRPVCAAICEIGQAGSNLFRLLDSVRLVPLERGGASARPTLMAAAKEWFGARGKETFLYLTEEEDGASAGVPAGRSPLPATLWCISATLLPEFLEHVCELTSSRRR